MTSKYPVKIFSIIDDNTVIVCPCSGLFTFHTILEILDDKADYYVGFFADDKISDYREPHSEQTFHVLETLIQEYNNDR